MSSKKPYFPFFVDVSDAKGIIIGGGMHAYEKILRMQPFVGELTVIAAEFIPEIRDIVKNMEGICLINREYEISDFTSAPDFVIVAFDSDSDKEEEKKFISDYCKERRIPVNVVDNQSYSSYIYPAMITSGPLSIGICTAGASPAAASILKEEILEQLPDHMDEILDWLEEIRPLIKKKIPDSKRRKAVLRTIVKIAIEEDRILLEEEVNRIAKLE